MKLDNVKREPVKPVISPVETITITFTREEAIHLGHLMGSIGGSPDEFPQRRTYDKLFFLLHAEKLAGTDNIGQNPLRWSKAERNDGSLYLQR